MAMNGNMHLECNYASNPYHECTESCFRKAADGKGRKDKKKTGTITCALHSKSILIMVYTFS